MSTIIPLERDPHAAVLSLLPWYARAQLDDAEMAEVQAHLQGCPRCQADLETERSLQTLHSLPPAAAGGSDVDAGLARMRSRIRAAGTATPQPSPNAGSGGGPRWLSWMLGLQGGAIAVLLMVLVWPRAELPVYRGLAAPAPAAAVQALIMFKPEANERQIRTALQSHGASLAGGPTESGAYVLRLPSQGHQDALLGLRGEPIVTLLEPLEAGGR